MGHKPRIKMPIAERAKQFAPFAAIRGLSEALRKSKKLTGIRSQCFRKNMCCRKSNSEKQTFLNNKCHVCGIDAGSMK